jgi:histone-lysine N-methyltransferase SETMAR
MTPSLTIGGKKSMIFVFFSLQAVLTFLFLRNGDTFNSDFLTNAVFLEIGTKIAEQRLQNALKKKVVLDMDSAPCHNSRQTTHEIEKLGRSRIQHPPYSPDISPCDFWLFGLLNETLKGNQYNDSKSISDAVLVTLAEIQRTNCIPVN